MKYLFNMYTTWLLGFILIALKIWLYSTEKQFMKKIGYAQCLIHSLFFHFERIPHSTLYNMYIDLCEWQPEGTVSIFHFLSVKSRALLIVNDKQCFFSTWLMKQYGFTQLKNTLIKKKNGHAYCFIHTLLLFLHWDWIQYNTLLN